MPSSQPPSRGVLYTPQVARPSQLRPARLVAICVLSDNNGLIGWVQLVKQIVFLKELVKSERVVR